MVWWWLTPDVKFKRTVKNLFPLFIFTFTLDVLAPRASITKASRRGEIPLRSKQLSSSKWKLVSWSANKMSKFTLSLITWIFLLPLCRLAQRSYLLWLQIKTLVLDTLFYKCFIFAHGRSRKTQHQLECCR